MKIDEELKRTLAHVLWIGGATDAGKTTVAGILAERHGLQGYNYDQRDLAQVTRLAECDAHYRALLTESLDERWVRPEPVELVLRALGAFRDRFPLVVEELLVMPRAPKVVAEGFGFTPELVFPMLLTVRQAVWLVPTEAFKRASMARRDKPSFRHQTSDPERAAGKLLARDRLLAEYIAAQARLRGLTVVEVDGTQTAGEMATWLEGYFGL